MIDRDITLVIQQQSLSLNMQEQRLVLTFPGNQGPPGIQGEQGPPGPPGDASNTYTHTQAIPSTTRTMTHNLGYNPNYIAVDSAGDEIEGAPSWPDLNTMVLTLSAATSGIAYLS